MTKVLLSTAITLISLAAPMAHADHLHCVFTEPFVFTDYDTATQTLTVTDSMANPNQPPTIIKNVSFQILGPASFQLINAQKQVVQTLTLNFKGSDGMSEIVYPYDVTYRGLRGNNMGGCESDLLKRVDNP